MLIFLFKIFVIYKQHFNLVMTSLAPNDVTALDRNFNGSHLLYGLYQELHLSLDPIWFPKWQFKPVFGGALCASFDQFAMTSLINNDVTLSDRFFLLF